MFASRARRLRLSSDIPMQPPPDSKMIALAKEKQEIRLKKKKEVRLGNDWNSRISVVSNSSLFASLRSSQSDKRKFLIEQRKEEFRQEQIKVVNKAEEAERDRRDGLWSDAVEHGKLTGELNMSWQKLGDISERVFNFRRTTGRDLSMLRLVGHDLEVRTRGAATNNIGERRF